MSTTPTPNKKLLISQLRRRSPVYLVPASAGVVPRTMATAPDHATVHEPGRDCTVVVPSTTSRGQHAGAVATLLDQTLHLVKGECPSIMPTARSHTHLGVHARRPRCRSTSTAVLSSRRGRGWQGRGLGPSSIAGRVLSGGLEGWWEQVVGRGNREGSLRILGRPLLDQWKAQCVLTCAGSCLQS